MTGRQSDMGFKAVAPGGARAGYGSKVTKLSGRARGRVELRGLVVEQVDIDNAVRENSHSCMIADAIKRQVKGVANVSVDIATIRYTDTVKKRRVMCLTPIECQRGLIEFDLGRAVRPFRFNLRSTQVTGSAEHRAKVGPDGQPVTREKRVKVHREAVLRDDAGNILRDAEGRRIRKNVPVVDANGEPVYRTSVVSVSERVRAPSVVKEFVNSSPTMTPSRDHIVGGRLPPGHRASKYRKFGAKGFTWDEGEDPEVVSARFRKAHGVADDDAGIAAYNAAVDAGGGEAAAIDAYNAVIDADLAKESAGGDGS